MPLVESTYRAPFGFSNGHVQTIFPGFLRHERAMPYARERIDTPDGDFLDLDWCRAGSDRVAVVSYGMESDSQTPYVAAMARALNDAGWDALVWNYRSCGGEPNRKVHFYHGGLVDDLHTVLTHALATGRYRRAALVGFSLGGNLSLNYLGRRRKDVPAALERAVIVSAPTDVAECAKMMHHGMNRFYAWLFLRAFRRRIQKKMKTMPGVIDDHGFEDLRTLEEYDERYTVPHFGFDTVPNFYRAVSSRYVVDQVAIPTLIISAKNDPLMGPDCYPIEAARTNPNVFLEMPESGGHLGFITFPRNRPWWMERRVLEFLRDL